MNSNQFFAVYIGMALKTLVLLFPPVETALISVSEPIDRLVADYATLGHTFLFAWPGKPIDTSRLLCSFLLVLVLTCWAIVVLRNRSADLQ